MFTVTAIGNLGSDAKVQNSNGNDFTSFRIAHNDRYKDTNGNERNETTWIDCVMQGRPQVVDYLKAGTLVAVVGHASLRTYSSPKDHCIKAGIKVSVRSVELVGSKPDAVPSRLYDTDGIEHRVDKYFFCPDLKSTSLITIKGEQFTVDANGFVYPVNGSQVSQSIPDAATSVDASNANPAENEHF